MTKEEYTPQKMVEIYDVLKHWTANSNKYNPDSQKILDDWVDHFIKKTLLHKSPNNNLENLHESMINIFSNVSEI